MKQIKRLLFLILLLFVGVLSVSADDDVLPATNIKKWESIVTDMSANIPGANNCAVVQATTMLDTFMVGNDCVATGIELGTGYMLVGRADNGVGNTGETYHGDVVASTNDMGNTDILLSEIVELIYNPNSATTKRLVADVLASPAANSATSYELKAGSSANALYVYGGYNNGGKAGIKINFNASTKEFTYSVATSSITNEEVILASFFTKYLIEYVMEAAPNYDKAIAIKNNESKFALIETKFKQTYGEVKYPSNPQGIEVRVFAKGDINNSMVNLYENATNANPGGTTPDTGNQGNNNNDEGEDDGDNPNTGAFVNIFAIVALISVGTVMVLGNRRKLFRI